MIIAAIVLDYPPTQPPSPRPTQPPSNRPTTRPTYRPTEEAPKPSPSPWGSLEEANDVDSSSEEEPDAEPVEETKPVADASDPAHDNSSALDDPGCSGEPCPVDSHCRSRYGSCGPGFIYCNLYSIWRNTCPPVVPGTRPTRKPTARPTKSPMSSQKIGAPNVSPLVVPKSIKPTFPPLAKPSLPTITEATPITPPSSFPDAEKGIAKSDTEEGDSEDSNSNDDTRAVEDNPKAIANATESGQVAYFQSPDYLNEWAEGRAASSGVTLCTCLENRLGFPAAAAFLFFLL